MQVSHTVVSHVCNIFLVLMMRCLTFDIRYRLAAIKLTFQPTTEAKSSLVTGLSNALLIPMVVIASESAS